MSRRPPSSLLTDEVSRFEAEVRRLACAIVEAVFAEEMARRDAAPRPAATPAPAAEPPASPDVDPAAIVATGKPRWTRESVIDELATWLLSGTAVEAAFLVRHGRPGLVAAAKRFFGRFDAALNAANLELAQRFPDGPPSKHARR